MKPAFSLAVLILLAGAACARAEHVSDAVTLFRKARAERDAGHLAEAASLFSRAARASSALRPTAWGEAATCQARLGKPKEALRAVEEAARAGFRDPSGLEADPDLAPLRSDPRWAGLVRRARASEAAFRRSHSDPLRARLVTTDLERLVRLLPLPAGEGRQAERIAILEREYVDRASPGLADFFAFGKIRDVDVLAGTIAALPRLYGGLDALTVALGRQEPRIRGAFRKMKELYPETWFPDVTFVAGHFRSGGTSTANGLVIGTEIYCRAPGVDLGEFPAASLHMLQPVEEIAAVVVHELTHFQQPSSPEPYTLLRAALTEGTADFVASLVLPDSPEPDYRVWGAAHDDLVRARFRAEMDGTDLSSWIANNDRATPDWPAPLGYYVGYRIARGYYERADDKAGALRQLILMEDPAEILRRSGYLEPEPAVTPGRP